MPALRDAIAISSIILDARETLKRLHGEEYDRLVEPYVVELRRAAGGEDVMSVLNEAVRVVELNEAVRVVEPAGVGAVLWVLAAATEICLGKE